LSCVESGVIKLWSLANRENKMSPLVELNAGANLTCLRKSKFNHTNSFLFATGGKDNDLKVWNLNNGESLKEKENHEPIFRAKNMPDNWMQLREPIWIMSMDFMDEKRVVVGTAHHQVKYINQ
jgi:ribosome biogenesis protein NSA1